MSDVTIDAIRKHVNEKGPKPTYATPMDTHWLTYLMAQMGERMVPPFRKDIPSRYVDSVSARIKELLPEEGQVILSGENTKVIIYDDQSQSYREAILDIPSVQFVPTDREFDLNGYKAVGSLELIPIPKTPARGILRNSSEPANILEKIIEFSGPVVEVGKQVIDNLFTPLNVTGYFTIKQYSK